MVVVCVVCVLLNPPKTVSHVQRPLWSYPRKLFVVIAARIGLLNGKGGVHVLFSTDDGSLEGLSLTLSILYSCLSMFLHQPVNIDAGNISSGQPPSLM